jgi:hypothetical protein
MWRHPVGCLTSAETSANKRIPNVPFWMLAVAINDVPTRTERAPNCRSRAHCEYAERARTRTQISAPERRAGASW